jgi:hypothetical protein
MATKLTVSYEEQVKAIRDKVSQYVAGQFRMGQFRNADQARFVDQVVPYVLAGRQQVSNLTDAYLTRVISSALGKPLPLRGAIDAAAVRGVPAAEVYARPFTTVWTALSQGKPYDEAVRLGAARAESLVLTDLQLAKTTTAQDVLANAGDQVIGYERIPSGEGTCALCWLASTQRYHREDLMPIHPGCNCDVGPIIDTGVQVIYPDRYEQVHQAAADFAGNYDTGGRNLGIGDAPYDYAHLVVENMHGEMGPLLGWKGVDFTSAAKLGIEETAPESSSLVALADKLIDRAAADRAANKVVSIGNDTPVPQRVATILDQWVQAGGSFNLSVADRRAVADAVASHGEDYTGTLYRGAHLQTPAKFLTGSEEVGKRATFNASSFSKDIGDAIPYAENSPEGATKIIYELKTAGGSVKVLNVTDRAAAMAGYAEEERITEGMFWVWKRAKIDSDGFVHIYITNLDPAIEEAAAAARAVAAREAERAAVARELWEAEQARLARRTEARLSEEERRFRLTQMLDDAAAQEKAAAEALAAKRAEAAARIDEYPTRYTEWGERAKDINEAALRSPETNSDLLTWLTTADTTDIDYAIKAGLEFTDPETGMYVKISNLRKVGGSIKWNFAVWDRGVTVGHGSRSLKYSSSTKAHMYHELFELDKDVRGSGFGTRWQKHVEDWYISQGLDTIKLTANIDVGGYAWARMGYDFADKSDILHIMNRIENELAKTDTRAFTKIQRWKSNLASKTGDLPTAYELSQLGYKEGAKSWAGKRGMLGTFWSAQKKLIPPPLPVVEKVAAAAEKKLPGIPSLKDLQKMPYELKGTPRNRFPDTVDKWFSSSNGRDNPEALARYNSGVADAFAQVAATNINVQLSDSSFKMIVRDGRWKTVHEVRRRGVGGGRGSYYTHRIDYERGVMGVPENVPLEEHPVYGYFSDNAGGMNTPRHYGNIDVVLRPEVKGRTTITAGDTLDEGLTPVPVLDALTRARTPEQLYHSSGGGLMYNAQNATPLVRGPNYWEAQIHGGVKLTDVLSIRVDGEIYDAWTATMKDKIREAGIQVIKR